MKHVDIVFDGPPGPESGRFIEVEDAAGNSINLGEWFEIDKGGPVAGSAVAYIKPTWILRIEDPRELRRQVDAVWELLDHRVDGQPFWTDRAANGGGETMDIGMAVALVLRHYRAQIIAWQDAWASAHSRETCTPDKLARWVAAVNEQRESQSTAINGLENEAVQLRKRCAEQERQMAQLCEQRENAQLRIKQLENEKAEIERSAESAKRAMSGSWNELTARAERAERERDQVAAEALEWTKAAHHLDHTIIAPPQLKLAAERVSNELASARVDRDGWKTAARTLGSKIEQPGELVAAIDSLRDDMKVTGQLCADNTALTGKLEAQRNEIATLRRHLDAIGMMLIPLHRSQTFTRLPHEIEEAARQHAQHREAFAEMAKVLGIANAHPQYLIGKVTDLRADLDARSRQLDAENAITARFRRALVVANSPKLDAAAELEEIRAIVLAALKRAELTPIEPLRSLAAELAARYADVSAERDNNARELEEMAQEMARGVHPEDVAQAVESVQTLGLDGARAIMGQLYNREDVRNAIVSDIDAALTVKGMLPGNILRGHMSGHGGWAVKAADAACDRFEGLLRLPHGAEAVADDEDDDDDEITIGLDDAVDVIEDVLDDNYGVPISENLVRDILAEFRARWESDPEDLADVAEDEPREVTLSEGQIDTIVDKLAERLAAKGHRVRLIRPR